MKKIGILTQPLHNNYGGLLQAFALQSYLKACGHEVITIDFQFPKPSFSLKVRGVLSNLYRKYVLKEDVKYIFPLSEQEANKVSANTRRFRSNYIDVTEMIDKVSEFHKMDKYEFDAYIVGSDQVWRPIYSPGLEAFYLSFLGDDTTTRRISYAASFGTDNCSEYTDSQIEEFAKLTHKFHALSVREDSGVKLCKDHFGVVAKHVIDPTMLLNKEDYELVINNSKVPKSPGSLMTYVLDRSEEKLQVIEMVADELSLKPFSVLPGSDNIYPPVEQWLRGFVDAEYVVTDSFHGVVFSIIFNKPFIAVGNANRGLARFESLLNMFSLKDRLVTGVDDLTKELINRPIDFEVINQIRIGQQNIAGDFINKALYD
ncbi:polysaccharide pyruvyl transferase family protein [Shewanella indica]|uniref:polysaccharide pyruvyl transferase family protein n=1 Tax=Shewanella indica TaxID=768528 RepID=UPI00399B6C8F